ncbi:MAG TPA: hypothetical protein VE526_07150 [Solirubrobacteraceae bacterium]|nr:hypothetical protein [Solirubrobacteraceae bacterium]
MVAGWREDSDRPALSPPEYLYLDSARTLAYLAQLDAGTIAREERSFAATDGIDGKVGAGGAELAVKSQRVGTVKYEVTATTTDRFYRLLGSSRAPTGAGAGFTTSTPSSAVTSWSNDSTTWTSATSSA